MDIDELCRHPEYRNYVCCYQGLAYAGTKLEHYTRNGLKSIHRTVYNKLAGKQPCNQRCSEVFPRQLKSWCETCHEWRQNLCKESKLQTFYWDKMMSWQWPSSYENIARYFLPSSWTNQDIQDIATSCHIWENCKKEFKIRQFVINNLRECRNTYVAHNPRLKVSDLEKAKMFDALKDLCKDQDVMKQINDKECLSELDRIEKGDMLSIFIEHISKSLHENTENQAYLRNTADIVMNSQNELQRSVEKIHERQISEVDDIEEIGNMQQQCIQNLNKFGEKQNRIEENISEIKDEQNELIRNVQAYHSFVVTTLMKQRKDKKKETIGNNAWTILMKYRSLFIAILAVVLYFLYNVGHKKTIADDKSWIYKDCLSEEYKYPFKQDLPLLGYIYNSEPIVGRKWLFETMESKLLSPNITSKGVAMVADMGYGKSSFVSHLLCTSVGEKGYEIKSHVVAFHICKFDVKSTHSPGRLIRRLIGFLATKSEEYGNIISMMAEHNIIYSQDFCENDPVACFDQSIIFPFKQLSFVSNFPWVFIIEALDECFEKSSGKNLILELLLKRVRELPEWFKVFVTSRNITELYSIKQFENVNLKSNDRRNIEDIKEYIKIKYLSYEYNEKEVESLEKLCEGNFLFLIHAIRCKSRSGNQSIKSLPDSLEEIYEINFDREFSDIDTFLPAKAIFEIISASYKPLSQDDILHVLEVSNITDYIHFRTQMDTMKAFLRMDKFVTLFHQSLHHWLINIRNKKYKISIRNGHVYISRFLFHELSAKRSVDIADLSIHVSQALNETLKKQFLSLDFKRLNQTNVNESLHNVIRKVSGTSALELLILHNVNVDMLQEERTPAFLATLNGNIDQLLYLLRNGANVSFVTKGDYVVDSYDILNKIKAIKQSRYYGYGLIHIAAKYGYENILNKLLEYNKDMIHWKTSLGQRASDIACELGNLNVLSTISSYMFNNEMLSDCIYYAAKFGNTDILLFLIEQKVNLSCISDEESSKSIEQMMANDFQNIRRDFHKERYPSYHTVYPLDKWWVVAKETPIHAAIRSGFTEEAKHLIKKFPSISNCTDSFGYTPLLLSVVRNQYDLLPSLKDRIPMDKCVPGPIHIQDCINNNSPFYHCFIMDGFRDIEEHFCPSSTTFAHLIAKNKNNEFLGYAIQEKINVDWNSADDKGNYPIHYAARFTNIDFIRMATNVLKLNISSINSRNGSTAYHISVKTPSAVSLYELTDRFNTVILDVHDKNRMGILHHSVLFDQNFKTFDHEYQMYFQNSTLICFKYLVKICNIDIQSIDNFGRNILHYALVNGHFLIIEFMTVFYPPEIRKLLSQKDVYKKETPIQYAIETVQAVKEDSSDGLIIAHFNPIFKTFFLNTIKNCLYKKAACLGFIKAWEVSFIFIVHELALEEFQIFIEPFLYLFLSKSKYVFHSILIFQDQLTDDVLRKHIIKSIDSDIQPSAEILKDIATYRPSVFNKCGLALQRSPLHYLALNGKCLLIENVILQLQTEGEHNNSSFDPLNCADENGRLAFDYILMKGDVKKSLQFLTFMKNTTNQNVMDVILSAVFRKKDTYEKCDGKITMWYFTNVQKKEDEIDQYLSGTIRQYKKILQTHDFCKNNSKMLSVVHLLSVSNMDTTVKTLVEIYGQEILNCMTTDSITPRYLQKLFSIPGHDEIIEENKEIMQPSIYAENYILFSVLKSLSYHNKLDKFPFCLLKQRTRATRIYMTQLFKENECIERNYFNNFFRYRERFCRATRSVILLLQSVIYHDVKKSDQCFYISKSIKAMSVMLDDILTCFLLRVSISTYELTSFELHVKDRIKFQMSSFTDALDICHDIKRDKLNVSKRVSSLMLYIRNFILLIFKRHRELIILEAFEDKLFDSHFYAVVSTYGYSHEYFLSKISRLQTKQLARKISKGIVRFDHLDILRKTSGYKALTEHLEIEFLPNLKKNGSN